MKLAAACCALLLGAAPALAQNTQQQAIGTGAHFQGYMFNEAVGVRAANLLLLPIAYELPLTPRFSLDLYTGWAHGSVERQRTVYVLDGPVDTRLRGSWTARPWAVLMVGLNLPTGRSTHDPEQAVVAGALATTLLGFREASWGTGLAVTSGVATAHRVGEWGVGFGASYRVSGEFEPRADTAVQYTPGNEALLRLALDRNIGESSKLTGGITLQNYSTDRLDSRDLFQSGNRWRGDVAYSFRVGRSTVWSLYVADIWRERGDVTLEVLGTDGAVLGDTSITTGTQNLVIGGLSGSMSLTRSLVIRPSVDVRMQTREDPGGDGYMAGFGMDVPLRMYGFEVLPAARIAYGRIEAETGVAYPFWGGEAGVTLRRRIR